LFGAWTFFIASLTRLLVSGTLTWEGCVAWWIYLVVGIVGGTMLAVVWLVAFSVLLRSREARLAEASKVRPPPLMEPITQESGFEPMRSFFEPDEDEPSSPLPSASMAPLSLQRYVEVRGAIEGWTGAGEDVHANLDNVFDMKMSKYDEAHQWWQVALCDAEDRLADIERQAAVFASRYGGTPT
jgi:hypothetical protein